MCSSYIPNISWGTNSWINFNMNNRGKKMNYTTAEHPAFTCKSAEWIFRRKLNKNPEKVEHPSNVGCTPHWVRLIMLWEELNQNGSNLLKSVSVGRPGYLKSVSKEASSSYKSVNLKGIISTYSIERVNNFSRNTVQLIQDSVYYFDRNNHFKIKFV